MLRNAYILLHGIRDTHRSCVIVTVKRQDGGGDEGEVVLTHVALPRGNTTHNVRNDKCLTHSVVQNFDVFRTQIWADGNISENVVFFCFFVLL